EIKHENIASAETDDQAQLCVDISADDELDLWLLSEDGEARRRFLKQAMIAGGGLAGVSLLQGCDWPFGGGGGEAVSTVVALANRITVMLRINGKDYPLKIGPQVTLLDALRERIGLTGSKKGCDRGQCGACTVLADGRRINSC